MPWEMVSWQSWPTWRGSLESEDDPALQPERTGLAWIRTLVALAGTYALVGLHAVHDRGWLVVGVASAIIGAILLIGCGWLGTTRSHRARRAMERHTRVTAPRAIMTLSVLAALVSSLAVASALHR